MTVIIDSLGTAKVYSYMGLSQGYHQICMQYKDIHITTFICREVVLEYLKMSFSLINTLFIFQRLMDDILKEYLYKFVLVYLDDILIYSNDIKNIMNILIDYY